MAKEFSSVFTALTQTADQGLLGLARRLRLRAKSTAYRTDRRTLLGMASAVEKMVVERHTARTQDGGRA